MADEVGDCKLLWQVPEDAEGSGVRKCGLDNFGDNGHRSTENVFVVRDWRWFALELRGLVAGGRGGGGLDQGGSSTHTQNTDTRTPPANSGGS